jgi:hypothetical protein
MFPASWSGPAWGAPPRSTFGKDFTGSGSSFARFDPKRVASVGVQGFDCVGSATQGSRAPLGGGSWIAAPGGCIGSPADEVSAAKSSPVVVDAQPALDVVADRVRELAVLAGSCPESEVEEALKNGRVRIEMCKLNRSLNEVDEKAVAMVFMIGRAIYLRGVLRERCDAHGWVPAKLAAQVVSGDDLERCLSCEAFCGITADEIPHIETATEFFDGVTPVLVCPCGFRAAVTGGDHLRAPQ